MVRIEDYALVGDLHTVALISTKGSIDWLCLRASTRRPASTPRWTRRAGRVSAAGGGGECTPSALPQGHAHPGNRLGTADGAVRVIDFMPPRDDSAGHRAHRVGLRGQVPMRGELGLRFDYGHIVPWMRRDGHGFTPSPVRTPRTS